MIQAVMLVMLGFFLASLLGLLIAPAIWSRAVRLTRKRIEATMPMSLGEIEAAQDRVRATYAVRVRRLETALSRARQKAAAQLVDNSRLQMRLAELKDATQQIESKLDERRNAATVFEQTIKKRFPELEKQAADLRQDLLLRSQEVQDLTNRLRRKEEDLGTVARRAETFEAEIARLREAMEKSSSDRSGRLLRRPSQWTLEDYRSEYDRLNLELSKLRQQLAQLNDREAHQVLVVRGELQRLSELILVVADQTQKPATSPAVPAADRVPPRIDGPKPVDVLPSRPLPWPQDRQGPLARGATPPRRDAAPLTRTAQPAAPAATIVPSKPETATEKPAVTATSASSPEPKPETLTPPKTAQDSDTARRASPILRGVTERAPAAEPKAGETKAPAKAAASDPASLNGGAPVASERQTTEPPAHRAETVEAGQRDFGDTAPQDEPAAEAQPDASARTQSAPQFASLDTGDERAANERETAAQDADASKDETPAPKPLADARELRALSELLNLNASGGVNAPKTSAPQTDIAREARQGVVIDGEAELAGVNATEEDEPGERRGKRSLLDRLRNTPETVEAKE
jgi:hypothetical protein